MFIRGLRAKPARFKTLNIMRAAAEPIPDNRRDDGIRVPGVPDLGSLLDEFYEKGIYKPRREGEASGEKGKREKWLKGMQGLKGHIGSLLQGFLYKKTAYLCVEYPRPRRGVLKWIRREIVRKTKEGHWKFTDVRR
jgi:hypothetical protein